jgi:hypothetical protein
MFYSESAEIMADLGGAGLWWSPEHRAQLVALTVIIASVSSNHQHSKEGRSRWLYAIMCRSRPLCHRGGGRHALEEGMLCHVALQSWRLSLAL